MPPRNIVTTVCVWGATGMGVGRVPQAPGTFGTLLGLLPAWGIQQLGSGPIQAVAVLALLAVGIFVVRRALPAIGRGHDPGCVVIDEIATVSLTFFLIPMSSPLLIAVGFLLHRLFDISKPPPARQLERLPGAWGVMADDCAAGVYSNLALRLLVGLWPGLAA